ncbi:MAG: SDH family Clp fold serine proteinase [Bacillota bacterium]
MDLSTIIWSLFLISMFVPALQKRFLDSSRVNLIRAFERKRKSRLITLIHRQESVNFLGVQLTRYISIEDSEQVLRAIRLTPDDMPIDIILHTPGGLVLASEQIARALLRHKAKVTVFVPHYAMSGGSLIALSADEIVMDPNAVLGPVDPQVGKYAASSILRVLRQKDPKDIDDETIILADMAEKAVRQVAQTVTDMLSQRMDAEDARRLATKLTSGVWTHDYPLTCEELSKLGFPPICKEMPREVFELMDLYPQPAQTRPSVQYVPTPYRGDKGRTVNNESFAPK